MRTLALAFVLVVAACGGGETPSTPEHAPEGSTPATQPGEKPADGAAAGAAAATPGAMPDDPMRRIEVQIDGNGYTPATIAAQPGEKLTLIFTRKDENNCGGEVKFPATGETHAVPVGTPVEVLVTAPPSGQLDFTCGMDMYKGAVVVQG